MVGFSGIGETVIVAVVLLQPVDVLVNVNVTVPNDTAVTTPVVELMLATAGALLTHVPPVLGVRFIVLPIHINADGELTAGAVTVIVVVVEAVIPLAS